MLVKFFVILSTDAKLPSLPLKWVRNRLIFVAQDIVAKIVLAHNPKGYRRGTAT
jgi:hypothetical protein